MLFLGEGPGNFELGLLPPIYFPGLSSTSPDGITGLLAWWDATDSTTMLSGVVHDDAAPNNTGTLTGFTANPYVADSPTNVNRNVRDVGTYPFMLDSPTAVNRNVRDASGNAAHGRLIGKTDAEVATDVTASGIDFDGTDDYLHLGAVVTIGTDATIVCTFSHDVTTSQVLIARDSNLGYVAAENDTSIVVRDTAGATLTFTVPSLGTSEHVVVVTKSSTSYRVYVDGTESSTGSLTGGGLGDLEVIGARNVTAASFEDFFNGTIKDVKIYSTVQTPAAAAAGTGDLLDMPMTDGSATTVTQTNSIDFDGTDDYVIDSAVTANSLDTTDATLAAWVKVDVLQGCFLIDTGTAAATQRMSLSIDGSGNLDPYIGGTQYNSTAAVTTGQWRHVAMVFDESADTVDMYIDGAFVLTVSSVTATIPASLTRVSLGASVTGSAFINGHICQAKIFNSALTANQVAALCNPAITDAVTPIGDWELSEDANDDAAAANHGTLTGFDDPNHGRIVGKTDAEVATDWDAGGLVFQSGDRVQMSSAVAYEAGDSSVAFRFKTSAAGGQMILTNYEPSERWIQITPSGAGIQIFGGGATFAFTGLNDGVEHSCVLVRSSGTVNCWIDGVESVTGGVAAPLQFSPNYRVLGVRLNGSLQFVGTLSDVAIWSKALSSNERQYYDTEGTLGTDPGTGDLLDMPMDDGSATTVSQTYSIDFDGTDDYVLSDPVAANSLDTTDFTVSAWVKLDALVSSRYIIDSGRAADNSRMGMYVGSTGNHLVVVGGGAYTVATGVVSTGRWYHLAMTFDESTDTVTSYVDGVAVATNTVVTGTVPVNITRVSVGSQVTGGSYWDGHIVQAKIHNSALTANQVAALANPNITDAVTPVGDWPCDGAIEDGDNVLAWTARTSSAELQQLTAANQLLYSSSATSVEGDGAADYMEADVDAAGTFDSLPADRTWAFWMRPDTISGTDRYISTWKTATGHREYLSFGETGGLRKLTHVATNTTSNTFDYDFTALLNTWVFVSVVLDGTAGEKHLYVNGSLVETDTGLTISAGDTAIEKFVIFATENPTQWADGELGDVYCYNVNLSPADIALLHTYGQTYWS